MQHTIFMQKAIALSEANLANGGGPFGAVVVKDGKIIGEGANSVVSHQDPTAHAEILAIRSACQTLKTHDLSGAVIYSSCEPCPMCLSAIWWARIDRIYYANTRHEAAEIGFDDALIYEEINKPLQERILPMQQVKDTDAKRAFLSWQKMLDKKSY